MVGYMVVAHARHHAPAAHYRVAGAMHRLLETQRLLESAVDERTRELHLEQAKVLAEKARAEEANGLKSEFSGEHEP